MAIKHRNTPQTAPNAKISKSQRNRFITAAREAGCSEDETVFDENLKKIVKVKSMSDSDKDTTRGTK